MPVTDELQDACATLEREVDAALGRSDRCRIDEVTDSGDTRYVVNGFRRTASAAPKRIVL